MYYPISIKKHKKMCGSPCYNAILPQIMKASLKIRIRAYSGAKNGNSLENQFIFQNQGL